MDGERSEKTGKGGGQRRRRERIKEEERKDMSQRAEHSTEGATGNI